MLKEIMLAIASNVDIVAKVITEVGAVIKDINTSNNENHNESEKTRKELLKTNREILDSLKQINDKLDKLTSSEIITVEAPSTEVSEEINDVTTNGNENGNEEKEESTVVTPVSGISYPEEIPASKQIINQVNDVFSFFESMTDEEINGENVNKGKTVITAEELAAAAIPETSSNINTVTSKGSVNIVNDIFQTPSETAMKNTSNQQVVNEYIPQTPPSSSETDDIIERLKRKPLPDSLKNIKIGDGFNSFNNNPEPTPVVQQPVQQTYQSPIITPQASNIYIPTRPQNRTFSLRINRDTKSIVVVCHDDNSTLEYKYMSEGYKMIVTKLKTENRMLSSLSDAEILEFLRTTIGREKQYGYSTRENGGIPFTGENNNNAQNTYPTPAPGYGYDIMNTSMTPITPQPSTINYQSFSQPVQSMNTNLGGYGYNVYQSSDEIRPMFQSHDLRLFS